MINELSNLLVSSFFGGGVGYIAVRALMQQEAKKALEKDIKEIHDRMKGFETDFVPYKVCQVTHSSINVTLSDINKKLDILLENAIK